MQGQGTFLARPGAMPMASIIVRLSRHRHAVPDGQLAGEFFSRAGLHPRVGGPGRRRRSRLSGFRRGRAGHHSGAAADSGVVVDFRAGGPGGGVAPNRLSSKRNCWITAGVLSFCNITRTPRQEIKQPGQTGKRRPDLALRRQCLRHAFTIPSRSCHFPTGVSPTRPQRSHITQAQGTKKMDSRKQAVSIRMSAADIRSVKRLAERLGVRDSDVIRFAVKVMLGRLAPLHDLGVRGKSLVPVFVESGTDIFRHFELDALRLDSIINQGADAGRARRLRRHSTHRDERHPAVVRAGCGCRASVTVKPGHEQAQRQRARTKRAGQASPEKKTSWVTACAKYLYENTFIGTTTAGRARPSNWSHIMKGEG